MRKRWLCSLLAAVMLVTVFTGLPLRSGAVENMTSSQEMIDVLKKVEGFAKRAYWDYSQWTVGYGTRCPNEMLAVYDAQTGRDITVEEAEELLRTMLLDFENDVNSFAQRYGLNLSQNEFDALVSLTYNCGGSWSRNDRGLLNMSVRAGATGTDLIYAMCLYSKVDTDYALVQRRLSEAYMYLEGKYEAYNTAADGTHPDSYRYVYLDGNGGEVYYAIHGYDGQEGSAPKASFKSIPTGVDGNGQPFVYSFAGWYTARNGGTKVEALDGSLANGTVLYAQWYGPDGQAASLPVGTSVGNIVTTVQSRVNIRSGPGTYFSSPGQLSAGSQITVTQTCARDSLLWGQYEGGWVCLAYTNFEAALKDQGGTVSGTTPTVTGIKLLSSPARTEWVQKQGMPDLRGSVLQINYSDGTVGACTLTHDMLGSFDNETLGQTTVKATYAGFEVSFPITVGKATVTFRHEDGTILSQAQYAWGETVTEPEAPTKATDEGGEYYFAGWSPKVTACSGNRVYTAVFKREGDQTQPDPTDPPETTDPVSPAPPETPEPDPQPAWPRLGLVTAELVNVRTGAGTSYSLAGYQLNTGDSVEIQSVTYDGHTYNWGLMADGNYVCMDYVRLLSSEATGLSGDMNGDGAVNKDDAIYLLRHVVFPNKYPININGDMNRDGNVNKDDAIYLLRHVVFPDKYPLNY